MALFPHETQTLQALVDKGYVPSVIYDIGASNGVWSDTIAVSLPEAEFHLFEPLAEAVPFYREDLRARLGRRPKFHLYPVALSDRRGVAEIYETHDGFGSSLLDRGAIPEVKQRIEAPLWTLDEFVQSHSLPLPAVMKLDVQGAERLILRAGIQTLRSADVLFLETWLVRGYGPQTPLLTEMIEFLESENFRLSDLGEQFRDERGRVYSVDAVFFSDRLLDRIRA